MNWEELGIGLALVLVIEGLLPFLSPKSLKQAYLSVIEMSDSTIRWVGLASMVIGLLILQGIRA